MSDDWEKEIKEVERLLRKVKATTTGMPQAEMVWPSCIC
jgi:hypothetical protein